MKTDFKPEPKLLNALDKMIKGISIELTKEKRQTTIVSLISNDIDSKLSYFWYIKSINNDKTLNLISDDHCTMEGVNIEDCIL